MCEVVDLRPAGSVQFEGEMQALADRLTGMLDILPGLLGGVPSTKSHQRQTLIQSAERVIRTMNIIDAHIAHIEDEVPSILRDIEDGEAVKFQTYDGDADALITSTLVPRCHMIWMSDIRCDELLHLAHDNDDFFTASMRPRFR